MIVCKKKDMTVSKHNLVHTVKSNPIQDVVNAVLNMKIATPADLIPIIESVAKTLGKIMNVMLSEDENTVPLSTNSTNDTSGGDSDVIIEDPCLALSPIDKINADKPGVVEYETDIGDSRKDFFMKQIIKLLYIPS